MKYSELKKSLRNHKLRVTDCRMDVLEFFQQKKKALTFKDLEDKFQEYDRVTLYRTLHSFTDNGLLHKIPGDNGFAIYGLCEDCEVAVHHHNHMHFTCNDCGTTECMDVPINIQNIPLPDNYQMTGIDVIISGLCSDCQNN
jgi:Fur family ferric uptake transcriptional regulator